MAGALRTEVIGDATLYLGDAREILPALGGIGACVTDPPYGIGFNYGSTHYTDAGGADYAALLAPLRARPLALLQYPVEMMSLVAPVLGPPDDVLAWVYPSNLRGRHFRLWGLWGLSADLSRVKQPARNPEVAKVASAMVDSYTWWEQPQVKNTSTEKTAHPCQVPVSCVGRVLRLTAPASVCDPFMGSGAAGVACIELGIPFVGIEIDPTFFGIACERIAAAHRQPSLFETQRAAQPSLFGDAA